MPDTGRAASLTAAQLGGLIGVSPRRIRQVLNEPDPPPQDSAGKFPCAEAGAWIRSRILSELGIASDGQSYDYEAERARLTHHQANISALDEEVKRKNLIPADVVESRWQALAANIRAKLLNLPGRGAVAVAGMGAVQEIERELRKLVYECLRELSNPDDEPAEPGSNA